jgi:hypothetical protein
MVYPDLATAEFPQAGAMHRLMPICPSSPKVGGEPILLADNHGSYLICQAPPLLIASIHHECKGMVLCGVKRA